MTTLPIPRYMGANTFTAQDYAGNIFYAYQASNADTGVLTMVDRAGIARTITPAPVQGRPALDCIPHVGLWFVGNKETGSTQPPPRHPVKEYVPFPAPKGEPGTPGAGVLLFAHPLVSLDWNGRVLNGSARIDVPALFGVAPEPAYLVRLSATAQAAGVIVRTGTEQAPYFVTLVSQVANVRNDTQGWTPGPSVYISTKGGEAVVYLQIVGVSV
jgi:hypothetical protein